MNSQSRTARILALCDKTNKIETNQTYLQELIDLGNTANDLQIRDTTYNVPNVPSSVITNSDTAQDENRDKVNITKLLSTENSTSNKLDDSKSDLGSVEILFVDSSIKESCSSLEFNAHLQDAESTGSLGNVPSRSISPIKESEQKNSDTEYLPSSESDEEGELERSRSAQRKREQAPQSIENTDLTDNNPLTKKRKKALKGQGNKDLWFRNKNQRFREKGEEYISQNKKKISSRKMGLRCESGKCAKTEKRKCNQISEEERQQLFNYFWEELDWKSRNVYVKNLVSVVNISQKTTKKKSRRSNTLKYRLKIGEEYLPVCKKMFLATLGVKEWSVRSWASQELPEVKAITAKTNNAGNKLTKQNKLSQKASSAIDFLNALPKLPSHYARSSSSKFYLEPVYQSYADVYRVYQNYCETNQIRETVGKIKFTLLIQELNIGLFQPKKDQCDLCFAHRLQNNISDEDYQSHLTQKDIARLQKTLDKEKALRSEITLLTADAQAIQLVPYTQAGGLYFKQKLACKNYTVYNLASKKAVCYVWHEGEGGLDSNNFTSCLLDFLEHEIPDSEKNKEVIIYTDGCNAQNRNTLLANALQHFVNTTDTTITQKYLVRGHTQMECDSVHASIERRKKNRELFSPANFVQIIKEARSGPSGPYEVKYIDHTFFNQYNDINYYNSIRPGKKLGDPCVTDLRALRYSKNNAVQYKIDFNKEWKLLPQRMNPNMSGTSKKLYNAPLPISKSKYEHLQSLKPVILKDYHQFYDNLSYAN